MFGVKDDVVAVDIGETAGLLRPVAQVYLASPFTGLDAAALTEAQCVRCVLKQEFLAYADVRFDVYDPHEVTAPGTNHTGDDVYLINHTRTSEADLIVVCATASSYGIGIECQIAADAGVPRLNVFKSGVDPSRMLLGSPARPLATLRFTDLQDLRSQVRELLPAIAPGAVAHARQRHRRFRDVLSSGLNRFIVRQRILHAVSANDLAETIGVTAAWVRHVERSPIAAENMTIYQLRAVSEALGEELLIPSEQSALTMRSPSGWPDGHARYTLDNLVNFVISLPEPDDSIVFEIWREYEESCLEIESEALTGRNPLNTPVSELEWQYRYKERQERLF